jgi:hypothetical protein
MMQTATRTHWTIFITVLASTAYAVAMLIAGDGSLALPLDDAYIYLQYAQNLTQHAPFQFYPGAPASTGATGWLWMGWLSLGAWAGLKGQMLVGWCFISSAFFLGLSAKYFARIAVRYHLDVKIAWILFFLNGPLISGFFNGLETPILIFLLLASIDHLLSANPERAWKYLFFLPFCRPEGQIAALGLVAYGLLHCNPKKRFVFLVPSLAIFAPTLMTLAISGSFAPDSIKPKSLAFDPNLEWGARIQQSVNYGIQVFKGLFMGLFSDEATVGIAGNGAAGNGAAGHWPPLALGLSFLGLSLIWKDEDNRPGLGFFLVIIFLSTLALLAWNLPAGWNRHRYLLPMAPLILIGIVVVLGKLQKLELKQGAWTKATLNTLLLIWCIFGSLSSIAFWQTTLSSSQRYHQQHSRMAEIIRTRLPQNARIAAFDVGILAFEGAKPIIDLAGVTDARIGLVSQHGQGAVWETIAHWEEDKQPQFAVLQEKRPDASPELIIKTGIGKPIYWLDRDSSGSRMGLFQLNLKALTSNEQPSDKSMRPVDALNVGLRSSEISHQYASEAPTGAPNRIVIFSGLVSNKTSQDPIIDSGRVIGNGEKFYLNGPGQTLCGRFVFDKDGIFLLMADGKIIQRQNISGLPNSFQEICWTLPISDKTTKTQYAAIFMNPLDGSLPYASYHWWLVF